MRPVFDELVDVHVHEFADEIKSPRAFIVNDLGQLDNIRMLPKTTNRLETFFIDGEIDSFLGAKDFNGINVIIGKKVEVSLRLFDIFERKRVFIFLWES